MVLRSLLLTTCWSALFAPFASALSLVSWAIDLENPRNSWVWQTPLMLRLLKHPRIQLVTCHQCQYGCQWKKPTSLLIWNCAPVAFKQCTGKVCSRTHKAHLQLTGISGKRFLTELAQVYSPSFSSHLMLTLHSNSRLPPSP